MLDLASLHRLGLVTLTDVRAAGASRAAWHRAHRSGLLVPVHQGVSRLATVAQTGEQAMLAATLLTDGTASHLSAACLWGAPVSGVDPVDVITQDRRRSARTAGIRVHRPTDVADLRPVLRAGIPTTSPLRTALDVGAVAPPSTVAAIIEHLVVHRLLSLGQLRRGLASHSRPGRTGLAAVRLVLDDWALGDKPPDSALEVTMALLRDHDLPPAVFHHVVACAGRHFELDFAVVEARVGLEVDGWAHHGSRRAFEADRERDAYLAGAGWVVLRFTWLQVRNRPRWVAERIGRVLAHR